MDSGLEELCGSRAAACVEKTGESKTSRRNKQRQPLDWRAHWRESNPTRTIPAQLHALLDGLGLCEPNHSTNLTTMNTVLLEPTDVLFFRDAIPMSAGQ